MWLKQLKKPNNKKGIWNKSFFCTQEVVEKRIRLQKSSLIKINKATKLFSIKFSFKSLLCHDAFKKLNNCIANALKSLPVLIVSLFPSFSHLWSLEI